MKCSAGRVAGFLRGDGSPQAELRMRSHHFFSTASRRNAEIHVLMPLRHAKRDALVELIFREPLGRGIHHADELVVLAVLFVEQRRRMVGIETEGGFHRISVVGEVVHLLRKFCMENLVPLGQSSVVVRIFF